MTRHDIYDIWHIHIAAVTGATTISQRSLMLEDPAIAPELAPEALSLLAGQNGGLVGLPGRAPLPESCGIVNANVYHICHCEPCASCGVDHGACTHICSQVMEISYDEAPIPHACLAYTGAVAEWTASKEQQQVARGHQDSAEHWAETVGWPALLLSLACNNGLIADVLQQGHGSSWQMRIPMDGRWPPGKTCSLMKSDDLQ